MDDKYVDPMTGNSFQPGVYKQMLDEPFSASIEDQLKDYLENKYGSLASFGRISKIPYSTLHNVLNRGSLSRASVQIIDAICDSANIDIASLAKGLIVERPSLDAEKPAPKDGDELSTGEKTLIELFRKVPPERQTPVLDMIEATLKLQGLL